MSETTSTTATVDERARTRAFTALALSTAALMGGGLFASGLQLATFARADEFVGYSQMFALAMGLPPLLLSLVSLGLGSVALRSTDSLARPVARAALTLSGLAILGAVLLMVTTFNDAPS